MAERGRQWVDRHLFNGAWYHQQIDVRDRSILERFLPSDPAIIDTYWNDEAGEIKYRIAEGSEIDQLNAQWHANLCGLGDLFDPAQRRTALRSLYRNNFRLPDLSRNRMTRRATNRRPSRRPA